MIAVDYIILNRDRNGANIEVLRNARTHTLRIAPLFDHGLSLLYSCMSDEEAANFNGLENALSDVFIDKIWNMIYERYGIYESL